MQKSDDMSQPGLYNATKLRSLHLTKGSMLVSGHKSIHVWILLNDESFGAIGIAKDALGGFWEPYFILKLD